MTSLLYDLDFLFMNSLPYTLVIIHYEIQGHHLVNMEDLLQPTRLKLDIYLDNKIGLVQDHGFCISPFSKRSKINKINTYLENLKNINHR